MNDANEMWSLPWHALLGDLAKEFGPEAVAGPCIATHGGAFAANSWLVRARSRGAPPQPVRR